MHSCNNFLDMAELWETREGQAVTVVGALVLFLLSTLLLLLRRSNHGTSTHKLTLPPSPRPSLPLLGNILHMRRGAMVSTSRLRQSLGPLFTLHMGSTPFIFVTSAALAHEALVEKGLIFASRPLLPSRALFTSNFRNINSAPYGSHWRAVRRNLVHEMLTMPKILSFKSIRAQVLDSLVSRLRSEAQKMPQKNGGIVEVYHNIRVAMFQLLLFMLFGFDMAEGDLVEMASLLDEVVARAAGHLQDFFPFLHGFHKKQQHRELQLRVRQVRTFISHIEKHKELKKLNKVAAGSYLETLLHMDAGSPLSNEDIVTLCSEFMVGGTDTTVTSLEWVMARLVQAPSIHAKLYQEIHDVIGDRPVEENDLPHLPYLQAVIKETLRLHPPGHLLLPHAVSTACKLGGYDIPTHAVVIFNVVSISRDPQVWEDPLEFKPERFLASDVDITGTKEVRMIPFGAGRRICPGLGLASMHMELFVARLVQAFEWSSFPAGEPVDLTERFIFTVRMKSPLKACIKERNSGSLTT